MQTGQLVHPVENLRTSEWTNPSRSTLDVLSRVRHAVKLKLAKRTQIHTCDGYFYMFKLLMDVFRLSGMNELYR